MSKQDPQRASSVKVWCTNIARILRVVVQTGANLGSFVDKHHILHVIDLIFG